MIYVTGDIHGDISRINVKRFRYHWGENDFVIIAGDCGLLWDNKPTPKELSLYNWLANQQFTTLFVDGNHENFTRIKALPVVDYMGGKAHKINDKFYHLMRGEVYTIQDKKIFTFGGGTSIDKDLRTPFVSWWPDEIFSEEEKQNAYNNLEKVNYEVDYVITHAGPKSVMSDFPLHMKIYKTPCSVEKFLDELYRKIKFKYWFFGHYHYNCADKPANCYMLYTQIKILE